MKKDLIKPSPLRKGDTVAIVSLSSGMLGEAYCKHNIDIGKKRLEKMGLNVIFSPNCLKGNIFLKEHPELRAQDLKEMFMESEVKAIICAIGGDDTYKLIPYLMEDTVFINSIREHPKIFTGFSDTTVNHLMLYKLGLQTFYGPNFLCDIAELSNDMLPYTEREFLRYLGINSSEPIKPSEVWYEERTDFSEKAIGIERIKHQENNGYELLQGAAVFRGRLLGGCLESMYDLLTSSRYGDEKTICEKYSIFPSDDEWENAILFIETSEECPAPDIYRKALNVLKETGVFDKVNGIIIGKPQNECYYSEYQGIIKEVVSDETIPILYNVNFGHAFPRCVLPYGLNVEVNYKEQTINLLEPLFAKVE